MLFIDTWGWLILWDRHDPRHKAAERLATEALEERAVCTTNFVFAETITTAYSRFRERIGREILDGLSEMLRFPEVRCEEINPDRFQSAIELRRRYHDKPDISFTDLTSMVVMRELGITDILTADKHFLKVNLGFRVVPGESKNAREPHRRGRRGR